MFVCLFVLCFGFFFVALVSVLQFYVTIKITKSQSKAKKTQKQNNIYYMYNTKHKSNKNNTKHKNKTRRKNYLTRSRKIRGNWKSDKYSPNNLSIHLLW